MTVAHRTMVAGNAGAAAVVTTPHTEASVAVTTTPVLAAKVKRRYALFINDSDTVVYLAMGEAAVLNTGIRLNANGGSYEMIPSANNVIEDAVNGIHGGSGTKEVLVTEY